MASRDYWYISSVTSLLLGLTVGGAGIWYAVYHTESWGFLAVIGGSAAIITFVPLFGAVCGLFSYLREGRKTKSLLILIVCILVAVSPRSYFKYDRIQAEKRYQAVREAATPTQRLFYLNKSLHTEKTQKEFIELLNEGANINGKNDIGVPLINGAIYAVKRTGAERIKVIDFLVEHGADVNIQADGGFTALHSAASRDDVIVFERLLKHGADINILMGDGSSVLHSAASRGGVKVVEKLLEHGVDMNVQARHGWTALHNATRYRHVKVIEKLLAHGADPTIAANEGETPLDMANKHSKFHTDKSIIQKYNRIISLLQSYNDNKLLEKSVE